MSKKDKLVKRLLERPSDFSYDEAKTLLGRLGYKEDKRGRTSGARVAFVNDETKHILRMHKPHPENILKKYQLEQMIEDLKIKE